VGGRKGGGWIDQWRQGTLAVRGLGHLGAAAMAAQQRPRDQRGRVGVALAASLAGDVVLARQAGTAARSRAKEAAVNLLDLAVWGALSGPGRGAVRPAVVATVVPTAIESGYRLGAGIDAVPVVEPLRRWEPAFDPPLPRLLSLPWSGLGRPGGWRAWRAELGVPPLPKLRRARAARLVGELAADVVPPMALAWAVRRALGRPTALGLLGWGAFAASGGYALARTRDDAQRSTVDLWQRRCQDILEEQRVAARAQSALAHNLLSVDPRAMLRELASKGFEPAIAALADLEEVASANRRLVPGADGTTLAHAVEGRPVVPEEDRFRFVEDRQVLEIRTWLAEVEELPRRGPNASPVVEVVRTLGRELTLRYGGQERMLRSEPPELAVRLEPTLPAVALGSVWTTATLVPSLGGAPPLATVAACALDGAAIARLVRKVALERRADRTVALLVGAGTIVLDVAVGLGQDHLDGSAGLPVCPGTGATQPLALLLAASWRDLGAERWPLVVAGLGAWAFSIVAAGHRSWGLVVNELAFLCMPAAAAATMATDARREAAALDEGLDDWLAAELQGEASALAGTYVDRFVAALDAVAAGAEAGALDLDPDALHALVAEYRDEAARLRATDPLDVINW